MDRLQGGLRWWSVAIGVVAAMAVVACGPTRTRIRYGSLVLDPRSFLYRPGVDWFSLPNGLIVALVPDERANLVSLDVRYLVGAAEDPPGKSGLAHLVEHMMFEHRAEPAGATLTDRLAGAALRHNANTTWDATHYHEIALAPNLDELLAIEATRMALGCHGLDEATFARERAVVLQEVAERGPTDVLEAIYRELFGPSHAYAHSIGGRDVAALTLADVCRFVDAHYAPGTAILVVGGRIDPGEMRRGIAARFGRISRRATGRRTQINRLGLTGGVTELHSDIEEPAALVFFPAAPWGSMEAINDNLIDRLLLLRLAGLARKERWITGVMSGHVGGERGGARYFGLRVADPKRLDDAVAQIFRVAGELPGTDSEDLISRLGAERQGELLDGFESIADRGDLCADYLQFTAHQEFHVHELKLLQDIDVEQLRLRSQHLVRHASHVVRLLPTKEGAHAARSPLGSASAQIDLPVWRAAVDPAEAERPLALPAQQHPSPISDFLLANGMRVLMISDVTQPVFEARLVFPVGEITAGRDKRAVAQAAADLLEHDFSLQYSLRDYWIVKSVIRLGAQLSAEVTGHTTFQVRGSSLYADWHLWWLYWLLENGTYDSDDVKRMKEAAARRDARHDARRDAGRSWRRAILESLFGRDHPYARDASVAAVRTADLAQFRETYYRAQGATLIIVGNFDATAMRKTVTELFGAWSGSPPPPAPAIPAMHPAVGPTWIAHADPKAPQVRITYAFAATSPRLSSRAARGVVAEMVRNRLEQVRTRLGASYGIEAGYEMTDAGDLIQVDGYVDADRTGEVVRQMQADLDGLRAGDATFAADFVRARRIALARALADPIAVSTAADHLEAAVANHLAIENAQALPAAIARTTLAEAREVIAQDLMPERMIVLLSGRPADTSSALAAAGVTKFQTVSEGPAAP